MSRLQAFLDGAADEALALGADAAVFLGWLLGTYVVGRYLLVPAVERTLSLRQPSETYVQTASRTMRLVVVLGSVVVAVVAAGYGSVFSGSGLVIAAATVAVSVAAQDVIRNLVSGAFLVVDEDVNVGDYVEWDGQSGVVVDIGFRASRIRTAENAILTVPNATLATTTVRTPYLGHRYMVVEDFAVGLDDDVDAAAAVMERAAFEHERTMDKPNPVVRHGPVGDGTVRLRLSYWIRDPERADVLRVQSSVVERILEESAAADVTLAPPSGRELSGSVHVTGEDHP